MVGVPSAWLGYPKFGGGTLSLVTTYYPLVTVCLVGLPPVWLENSQSGGGTLRCVGVSLFLLSSTLVLVEASLV